MLTPNIILQNRYRIIKQLGQGGMGTVYEAIDQRFDSQVAIKETHFNDEVLRKQFEREARLLNRLRHPAMTRVIDHFSENDGQFLVMDFVAGEELWEMLQKQGGAFPVEKVLSWADQLLDALNYLHKQDPPIIHRDIKPQNLKLSDTDQIILLDFGLAKGFAGQISRVTTSGSIFGYTPNYAPLEQIQGTGTDPRSDLYSLAATLYHLMTGIVPSDVLSRLTATTDGQLDPLRLAHEVNPSISADVAALLNKAMAVARNQRFSTAFEMRNALRDIIKSREPISDAATANQISPTVASPTLRGERPKQKTEPLPSTLIATTPTLLASLPESTPLTKSPADYADATPPAQPSFFIHLLAIVSGWLTRNIVWLLASQLFFSSQLYLWFFFPVSFISLGSVGALFGFKWPQKQWKWGLWLITIPWLFEVFSITRNFEQIIAVNIWSPIVDLILVPTASCIGAYLGARLSLKRTGKLLRLNT